MIMQPWDNTGRESGKLINIVTLKNEPVQRYPKDIPRSEQRNFVVDFDKVDFSKTLKDASSFEELQKASRDLEKRLHEKIIKSSETNVGELQRASMEKRQQQSSIVRNCR